MVRMKTIVCKLPSFPFFPAEMRRLSERIEQYLHVVFDGCVSPTTTAFTNFYLTAVPLLWTLQRDTQAAI